MKRVVLDIKGSEKGKIELNDSVFNIDPNMFVIYEGIKNELANRRQGTSSTKTKREVRGSGIKPHRQKGTGRARVGTRQNPVWRGGGVAFGPKPRDFSYKLPKKIKRLSHRSVLSLKNRDDRVFVIENFSVKDSKSKNLSDIVLPILKGEKSAIVVGDSPDDLTIKKAARNLSWLRCLSYKRMSVHTLFYTDKVLFTEDAVKGLNSFFEKAKKEV